MDRTLWPSIVLLLAIFAVFELTPLDLIVQDWFYDFDQASWLVDQKAFWPRVFFYNGPKYVIIAFAVALLVFSVGPRRWLKRVSPRLRKRDLCVVLATLATGPSLIALSKATTNVFCPYDIERYGGKVPYVKVLESYPQGQRPEKRGRGFPAGHASGGYALMSLAGLWFTRKGRWTGFAVGMSLGTLMGVYQMFKGAHYLSHTVVTVFVCWILFLVWRRVFHAAEERAGIFSAGS